MPNDTNPDVTVREMEKRLSADELIELRELSKKVYPDVKLAVAWIGQIMRAMMDRHLPVVRHEGMSRFDELSFKAMGVVFSDGSTPVVSI